ncbi:MAG TPA: response regulator [Candidatus Acidoferrales bacterium]|nr:response regulator [Candidatus Acidoferrales bacterium]
MTTISERLLTTFLGELQERLAAFEQDLLALEGVTSDDERHELINGLFREAHSLKGAANAVGLAEIADVCHRAEDLLATCRDQPAALDERSVETLFGVVDSLRARADRLRAPPSTPAPAPVAASGTTAATPVVPAAPAPVPVHDTTLRVASEKLDVLLQHTGELLVALSTGADRAFLERSARRVDEEVRNIRMLPFSLACEGLERIVRDCSAAEGKKCRLHILGGDIELDRAILDGLRDPLQHLVRNSVIHGIEPPSRRAAVGKATDGSITVSAALHGGGVEVTVSDDGNGLDLAAIRARAEERGYAVNDLDVGGAIFLPGVSTARGVTKEAGRGVGMDAVRSSIEALRGTISVHSEAGEGARFVLLVPLTLTTVRAVLFEVAGHTLAIESAAVERFVRPRSEDIVSIEGRQRIIRDGAATPLVDCASILNLGDGARAPQDAHYVIFIKDTLGRVALAVDELIEEREVVVRPFRARLGEIRTAIGATILGDGSVAPILRGGYIVQQSHDRARPSASADEDGQASRKRVLLVEDSITTRTLERSILEAAGYDVATAGDGEEAWSLLQDVPVDLVVTDVDMPRLDGFGLTQRIRGSQHLADLPVVLVTARGTDEDKRRGVDAGADAYVTKGNFDQGALLQTLAELL